MTEELRQYYNEAVLLYFPGDELAMGGCVLYNKREQVEQLANEK